MRYSPAAILLVAACASWTSTGSVYRTRCVHVGIRPASDGVGDYAATVQVSADRILGPPCAPERDSVKP